MLAQNRIDMMKGPALQVMELFASVDKLFKKSVIDPMLRHLIELRVSQINGCAYCVNMHTREAREDGETNERLDHLAVWRVADDYSAPERAAFAWAEAMTVLNSNADPDALHKNLRQHFSDEAIAMLSMVVVMINAWNRIGVISHNESF